jgi:hypothetical protein
MNLQEDRIWTWTWIIILTHEKTDFKLVAIRRGKEGHYNNDPRNHSTRRYNDCKYKITSGIEQMIWKDTFPKEKYK